MLLSSVFTKLIIPFFLWDSHKQLIMATLAAQPYSNAKTLISFLTDTDPQAQGYALKNLLSEVDYLWHELIDHLDLL